MDENEFIPKAGDLVLRDDQADFFAILDEGRKRRKQGARLRLIDSGHASVLELERLCLSGAEIFTSDGAGRTPDDLTVLNTAAEKSGVLIAHFQHGPLLPDSSGGVLPLGALRQAARRGICLYLSNKTEARRTEDLIVLAEEARLGRRRLGYYHHGEPTPALEELARRGAWIHVSADPKGVDSSTALLRDVAVQAAAAGAGLVIHLEHVVPAPAIEDLWEAGAYLLFRIPPSDYRSAFRILEEKAARRPLDPRAYYLYNEFMR